MKMVNVYTRPESLNSIKQALYAKGIYSMSVSTIKGAGRQKGFTETYRGVVMEVNLLNKVRIEIGVNDDKLEEVLDIIKSAARTGKEGDGVIMVLPVERVVRIRTGEENL